MAGLEMSLERLVAFYQELSPESIARFPELYDENAYFKDPFNEVRGVAAIQRIFIHMFRQVAAPRFVVTATIADRNGAMLGWEFSCRVGLLGKGKAHMMRGVSHLRFGDDGRVFYHRDYWDTAEELYMKWPGIGLLIRFLRRMLAA